MTLRDELNKISEEAKKQEIRDPEKSKIVAEYLTEKLKEAAAKGEKQCIIELSVLLPKNYFLDLEDVINFAEKNNLNYIYARTINVNEITVDWK